MKKLFVILLIHISITVSGQWVQLNPPTSSNINSVFFLNDMTGWICGDSGMVMKTFDAGKSWTSYNVSNFSNLLSIQFYDYQRGVAVGSKATIYVTEDGGYNWSLKNLNPDLKFYQVRYIDSAKVLVVGEEGTILYSSDWGNNWQKILNPEPKTNFYSITFSNTKKGWIGGDGYILATTNGGTLWKRKSYSLNATRVFALNDTLLWRTCWYRVIGNFDPPHYYIEQSTNSGASWTTQVNSIGDRVPAVYFADSIRGFVLNGFSGGCLVTTNGGLDWSSQSTGGKLSDFCFINIAKGWIVGDAGVMYRTTNGGGLFTEVEQQENNLPTTMLLQNYPNPFNPVTKITYSIPQTGFVKLKVFDLLGNEIMTLVNEEKLSGNYEVEFDGSRLPSGIYFYQAIVGKNVITKKMALIK